MATKEAKTEETTPEPEVNPLAEKLRAAEEELRGLRDLPEEAVRAKQAIQELQTQLETSRAAENRMAEVLSRARTEKGTIESELLGARHERAQLENRAVQAEKAAKKAEASTGALVKQKDAFKKKVEETEPELRAAKKDLGVQLTALTEKLRTQQNGSNKRETALKNEVTRLQKENRSVKNKNEELTKEVAKLSPAVVGE